MVNIGDMTIQGQAAILPQATVVTTTRDMSLAGGTQAITGVGFKPSFVMCAAASGQPGGGSFGAAVDGGSAKGAILRDRTTTTDNTWAVEGGIVYMDEAGGGGVAYYADIQSLDSDGFTLSWTKAGSPTGTIQMRFLCFK